MTHETTVSADKEMDAKAASLAVSSVQTAPVATQTLNKATAIDPASAGFEPPHSAPSKRKMTHGEIEFNVKTYAGWGLVGNEVFSLAITESVDKSQHGTPRFAHGAYKKFEGMFAKLGKHFERFSSPGFMRSLGDYTSGIKSVGQLPRLPYLLIATIGGMLVVPFVKDREDRKGEIVRKLDRKHYGVKADSDPALVEAHKEMDDAPKQSWGSLWKGRFTTVIFAAIADFTFGWPEALTTKAFKTNATYQKFSSLERISNTFADWSSKSMNVKPANEWLFKKVVGNGTWLLTLSSSLTAIFYISSKIFAKKRDEKMERHTYGGDTTSRDEAVAVPETQPKTTLAKITERPEAKVSGISHEATLGAAKPQLAASH